MKNTNLTPIEKARADLEQANIEMRALEDRAKFLRGVITYLGGMAPEVPASSSAIGKGTSDAGLAVASLADRAEPTKEAVASAFCEKFVEEHGPTSGRELWTAFTGAGHVLTGKDRGAQMVTLAGYLARVGKLQHSKLYGRWWFVGRPFPGRPTRFI